MGACGGRGGGRVWCRLRGERAELLRQALCRLHADHLSGEERRRSEEVRGEEGGNHGKQVVVLLLGWWFSPPLTISRTMRGRSGRP